MTADFQILMPSGKKGAVTENNNEHSPSPTDGCGYRVKTSSSNKFWPFLWITIFMLGLTLVFMGVLVKYEDKLEAYQNQLESHQDKLKKYEERISDLETDLDRFMKSLMADPDEEMEYETHAGQEDSDSEPERFVYDDEEPSSEEDGDLLRSGQRQSQRQPPKEFKDESTEEKERLVENVESSQHFGKVLFEDKSINPTEVKSRRKRQIPFPNVPTFGPNVERTGSGVPIVQESYLSSTGVTLKPRPASTTQSEGLHLYERLVERGGLPSSRTRHQGQSRSTLLPHHQVSAAWSDPSSRIQLKSGDSSAFGSSASSETSQSSSSRRSQHYSSHRGSQSSSRPVSSTSSSNSNPFISGTSSVPSGTTHHRNSRVPSTGEYFYPSSGGGTTTATKTYSGSSNSEDCDDCGTRSSRRGQSRVQYPPLRTLTVGDGEGEVIARVLQTDRESTFDSRNTVNRRDRDNTFANAALGDSDATASRQVYRPSNSGVTSHASTQTYSGRGGTSGRKFGSGGGRNKPSYLQNQDDDEDLENSGEISVVKAEAWVEAPKPLAAHFVADVSNYTTAHRHYDGNGRLRNADGIFEAWRPADWMAADGGSKNFQLSPTNGELTLKSAGLYYVYAQIHYLDDHDINGFVVQVNKEPFLQCTTMTETYSSGSKSNSCFTAGIQYFKAEDKILIKDIETNRYSIFKPEKSFFGLMKVGAVP